MAAASSLPLLVAWAVFLLSIAVESVALVVFLHVLRTRHPRQWLHARLPDRWHGQTVLSARRTMLYLRNHAFLGSVDGDGIRHCARHRLPMLLAYRATAVSGLILLWVVAARGG